MFAALTKRLLKRWSTTFYK